MTKSDRSLLNESIPSRMKQLCPSYELAWRTEEDKRYLSSAAWKRIRQRILERDDYTCQYCGFRSEKGMSVNHVSGDPKDNQDSNLETICRGCHMVMHTGLWCSVKKSMILFKESNYSQSEIVRITRDMRGQGKSDAEIVGFLGLRIQVPWKQNFAYLKPLFAFATSNVGVEGPSPALTEEEQRERVKYRNEW